MENSNTTSCRNFEKQDLLRLFLGLNDKFRMPPEAWEFLSIRDLMACASLSKDIWQQLASTVEYTRCRDGKDYLVPFPGFPGLLSTPDDMQVGAGLFPHQLASLHAMYRLEHSDNHFGSLRGGILGDAPGLGKTITMLALIANTAGRRPVPPPEFWDASGIAEGWKNMRVNEVALKDFLTALRPIRTWVQSDIPKTSPHYKKFQELTRYISPPFKDDRFPTIRDLELYVYRELRDFVPRAQLELFRNNMIEIKAGLDKGNRKLLKGPMGRRLQQERKLIPSSATLIIVPDALLEHWFQQIHMHLHLSRFEDQNDPGIHNIVYVDGLGDFADMRLPLRQTKSGLQVPPAYMLAQYFIVVTTFSRCRAELAQQVKTGRMGTAPASNSSSSRTGSRKRQRRQLDAFDAPFISEDPTINASPFLQLRWLRVVVDEGHELGTHEAATGVTQFIHEIAAERRWVLSGTPTTGDEDDNKFSSNALDQLQRLLVFLRHPMYGNLPSETSYITGADAYETNKDQAKKQWLTKVKTPFLSKKIEGRMELERVLTNCLVMHRKEDIKLPKPIFRQAEVDAPVPEPIQVEMRENAQSALTILDNYLHTDDYQSLVDEAQAKFIIRTLGKAKEDLKKRGVIRNVGGGVIADYEHMDLSDDRRPIKAVVYSRSMQSLQSVTEYFYKNFQRENIAELYDLSEVGSMGAEMSRFRHDFKEIRVCPICQRENDLAASDGRAPHRCRNTLVEVVEETSSRHPARFLVEPERIVRALSSGENGNVEMIRMDGHSLTLYNKYQKFWKVGDILEINVRADHPLLPTRWSDEQWFEYGTNKCIDLARQNNFEGSDWYFGPLPPTEQRRNTMRVKLAKWQPCGKFHNHARWYDGPRLSDAPIRKIDEDVFLLSLDAGLSHGLDLSFVTHMFLLEPIEDAALLEQVTSRAHRLGAKGPVRVETVNPFYNVSEETDQKMEKAASTKGALAKKAFLEEKAKVLTKVCCAHCFRDFDSHALAEHHEQTNCPRNPEIESTVAPFHLSSVYRDIKPPPAVQAKAPTTVLLSAH
jgi:hypothetical protein